MKNKRVNPNLELLARLDPILKDKGWSDRKASLAAGLDADAIRNLRRGWEPRAAVVPALANGLGVDVSLLVGGAPQGLAEAAAPYVTDLRPDFRTFITTLAADLGRAEDPELVRLFAILAVGFEEWRAGGKPFDPRAYLAKAAKLVEIYYLPGQTAAAAPSSTTRRQAD